MTTFTECGSLSINYNNMGIATISYTLISTDFNAEIYTSFDAGKTRFTGIVTNIYKQLIANSDAGDSVPWYTINVTLVATGA